jgi:Putative peptidoglycan binding domain
MQELTLEKQTKLGRRGKGVKRVQEWLTLQGFAVKPDGTFGAATETALKRFQKKKGLRPSGVVDPATFEQLVAPMRAAVEPIKPGRRTLGQQVVAYARQHLKQGAREVGPDNSGPWVRLYMNGNEGPIFPWCAGFACFVLKQATESLGVGLPITPSFGVDELGFSARANDRFIEGSKAQNRRRVKPGSLFLSAKAGDPDDWSHVGIFVSASGETFTSIEGNTNDEGSFEGFEVCTRTRDWALKDFIRI